MLVNHFPSYNCCISCFLVHLETLEMDGFDNGRRYLLLKMCLHFAEIPPGHAAG